MLDAGDLFFKKFAGPFPEASIPGATEKAQLMLESFNIMGYDAMGIGDDDLTLGKEVLAGLSKKAKFPFLSSNVMDEETGKVLFEPSLIKMISGLRIGIFSLLSPDLFSGPGDSRRKGIVIRDPAEVAQEMVKELQPKTDLIILLSHLSYPKDMEFAQAVSGIHLIVGGHTGMHLAFPPIVKNSVILQTGLKGMYAARFHLTFNDGEAGFYNVQTKRSLQDNLTNVQIRLNAAVTQEAQKVQLRKTKEDIEKRLGQFRGKNEFENVIVPLTEQIQEHPEIAKRIEAYKTKFPETASTSTPQPEPPGPRTGPRAGPRAGASGPTK